MPAPQQQNLNDLSSDRTSNEKMVDDRETVIVFDWVSLWCYLDSENSRT